MSSLSRGALERKREIDRSHNKQVGNKDVPLDCLSEENIDNPRKDHQSDALLQDLQLRDRKRLRADTIRRHLKNVFEESDEPTDDDHEEQRFCFVFQVSIPRKSHEDV